MKMQVEVDLGPGLHQTAGAFRKYVGVLSERVLVEEGSLDVVAVVGIVVVLHGRGYMMDRPETLGGFDLDRLDISILGEARIHQNVDPSVGRFGGHQLVFRQRDDQIRLIEVPLIGIVELARPGHIGGISLGRAGIHPFDDGRDLLVGQRHIVLEVVDAYVLVDVPGRHLAREDFLLDRLGPRPRFFISQQRHGRERVRPMAGLAAVLKDGRDVFGKRDLALGHRRDRDKAGNTANSSHLATSDANSLRLEA